MGKKIEHPKALTVGPYDFQEQVFLEKRTLMDYTNISALMLTLQISVLAFMIRRPIKWALGSQMHQNWKEAIWQLTMDHFAYNCSWRQLRILTPVRPLRVELQMGKYTKLPGYNFYFGGENYSARWLCEVPDRKPEDPVILYLHGGSYALKTQKPQIEYMASIAAMLQESRVSVLILDYTIGPVAKYPVQLNEAMACYEDLSKCCKNIIAFGDSCGGHLALTMLLKGARFNGGLILVSPSTDMTNDAPDDVAMREVFTGPEDDLTDPLISPLYADPAVWQEVLPKNTAVVWGGDEICKPQMIEWATLAKVKARFEEPQGGHDCILRGTKNAGSVYIQSQLQSWLIAQEKRAAGIKTPVASPRKNKLRLLPSLASFRKQSAC